MKIVLLALLIFFGTFACAQSNEKGNIYKVTEVDSLPVKLSNGKYMSLEDYILSRFKWNEKMHESEKVVLSYVVDSAGYITLIDLISTPKTCHECLREFLYVLTSSGLMLPGKKSGNPVSVIQTMTFHFLIRR